MCEVSIVVPVYKVEKYINRCMESLINQSLHDIEIILVDDGSPDSCPELCERWAKKDDRIKVVHKNNGGLSSARNAGLKIATGKYVGFVDSDDDVELDMFEKMLSVAEMHQVDFVMADYQRVDQDGTFFLKTLDIEPGYYSRAKIERDIFPNLIMRECVDYGPLLSVWHCLYRTDFLRKNGLQFDEDVRWSEDNIFSAMVGYRASSFYYMKGEGLYHYHHNPGTITTSYRKGAWQVYCTMNDHLHDFFDGIIDFDFNRQLKLHMIYYACNCIGMEVGLPFIVAWRGVKRILDDEHLQRAYQDFLMPDVSMKLKLQLIMMKYRCTLLFLTIKRMKK